MNKYLFVLVIPGSGTKKPDFSKGFQKELKKYTKNTPLKGHYTVMECRPFNETGIDQNQEELYARMDANNRLGGILSLRKAVLHFVGDAVLFDHKITDPHSAYRKIHHCLKERIEAINALMKAHDESRLVIVAASMGVYVLTSYIWDADHSQGIFSQTPATAENNLRNLNHLASVGCNIPLYVSGLKKNEITAIDKRNTGFTWDNYYDKDDVLGWPLQPLSNSYNVLVTDHEINSGAYVGAHMRYWTDKEFVKPLAERMVEVFER